MATDEREVNSDQSNEEISNREGKEGKQEAEPEEKIEGEGSISKKEVTYTSEMLLRGYDMSAERLSFIHSGSQLIGPKNIAETFVTRSMVDRYGPIVSPTVSPTVPYETNASTVNPRTSNQINFKTARDYEAAASICSMRDSMRTLDAMRVSRISTLYKPPSSASIEYTTCPIKREGRHHSQVNGHHTGEKENAIYQNGSTEYATKDTGNHSYNNRDDTDISDGENEDFSMIVRPRELEHENQHDSSNYSCRLPCCVRTGYRTGSPESGTYSPIRVPARRLVPHPAASPPYSCSESEQNGGFDRHQNGNKSAFTAVSPGKKRNDVNSSYANTPSVKVRVIQECSIENDRVTNGRDVNTPKRMHLENAFYPRLSMDAIVKSEFSGKTMIYSRSDFQSASMPKNEEFPFIKSAITKDGVAKKEMEENHSSENKTLKTEVIIPHPTSSFINGITFSTTFNGYSFVYSNSGKGDSAQNGIAVQCSTVDSTASEADSRLLDLARIANEQLGEELAKQQPVSKRVKQKSNDCLHLWEFLRDILNNETMSPRAIEWTVKERGEFRLIKTGVVAQLWGLSKNRTSMTYEKMARAMRYYYKMKILEKVPHKRLHFRFGKHMLPKVLVLPNGKKE